MQSITLWVIYISIMSEFKEFLEEYKVIGLAIAVIMGLAANALVQSLVKDIIMPIVYIFHTGWGMADLHAGHRPNRFGLW